jgi:hypothetical protein
MVDFAEVFEFEDDPTWWLNEWDPPYLKARAHLKHGWHRLG